MNDAGTKKNVAICTTTIFPMHDFLRAYRQNIAHFGREDHVRVYVAGDNKSVPGSAEAAADATRQGLRTTFMSIREQHDYLKAYPDLDAIIPENSDNRRNVAYLRALEEGADVIISVDDDNLPLPDVDFVGEHVHVGRQASLPRAVGHNGWFNLCGLLLPKDRKLYPRGFPYRHHHPEAGAVEGTVSGRLAINVGLWKNDPDTDAIGRLYGKPVVECGDGREVALGSGVRCPINTQNTALSREAMTAYYYIRMPDDIGGLRLDRFGDIFSGYFVQLCADAVGERIRIGSPIADHRRNQHNLLVDLYHELAGIMIIEDMAPLLASVSLPGGSYASAYRALSREIEEFGEEQEGFIWRPETKLYFHQVGGYMRIWADVVESLQPSAASAGWRL